jgi:hypothetical protein
MPTCTVARCLGHAAQTTVEVVCVRCRGTKWVPDPLIPLTADGRVAGPPIPLALPYTCHRCRAVLAGRNAVYPIVEAPSAALVASRAAAGARLRALRASRAAIPTGNEAPKLAGAAMGPRASLTVPRTKG